MRELYPFLRLVCLIHSWAWFPWYGFNTPVCTCRFKGDFKGAILSNLRNKSSPSVQKLVPDRWCCLWICLGPAICFPQNGKSHIVKWSLLGQGMAQ